MSDLYVVPSFAGAQSGTKDNPFAAPTSADFDALQRQHPEAKWHLNDGVFPTAGTREWDPREGVGFKFGNSQFTTETGATLKWDSDAVPDDRVDDVPLHLLCSAEPPPGLSPEQTFAALPVGQAVQGLTLDLNFAHAVDRWRALGKMLRISGVLLSGDLAAIERVHVVNAGAWGYEGFPLTIAGAIGAPARNLIAQLDPAKYVLDANLPDAQCSHITDCLFDQFDETLSNDQVTVRMIVGCMGQRPDGSWVQTMRAYAYQRGNTTTAKGQNEVQAHTIYQVLRGSIDHNSSDGAAVGAYGDFCATKRLDVSLNQFLRCDYSGIRFFLSPTGPCPEQFSHELYTIGPNQITSKSGVQVDFGTFEDQLPLSATRYMRDMKVDASLVLEAKGTIPGIVRTGQAAASAKGCHPFGFLHL